MFEHSHICSNLTKKAEIHGVEKIGLTFYEKIEYLHFARVYVIEIESFSRC